MAERSEIVEWVKGSTKAEVRPNAEITRVSAMEDAERDAAVFALDENALKTAIASRAGLILANSRLNHPDRAVTDERVVWVRDARYGFAVLAQKLAEGSFRAEIHPTAMVGEEVEIGPDTSIGPGVVLGERVKIGRACRIDARVTIYPGAVLGDEVIVQSGAVLGSAGFGYAASPETGEYVLFPQQGRLVIEDRVEIGANTTIDRGALGETRIGYGTKIDNLVHIGHNCRIGRNVVIAAQTGISGSSVVEDGAVLGGQVGIGEHATVGAGVILGGGAGVLSGKKMQGAGQVFWGRPARPLKEYLRDLARLKRGGDPRA